MKQFLLTKLNDFRKDCTGGILVFFAIASPVLIGIVGLSVDVGMWYAAKRVTQSAVDAAALAGAFEVYRSPGDSNAVIAAINLDALNHGFSAANGDDISINLTNSPKIEVIITRPAPSTLSHIIFPEQTNIQARAVAQAQLNDTCIWAINPDESGAVNVAGGASVDLGCGVLANSSSSSAIDEDGTGCLTALEIKVVGGATGDCINPTAETLIQPVDDPLAALQAPDFEECTGGGQPNNLNGSDDYVLIPGVYCTDISISTTGTVTFLPGLYILDGAGLTINGQSIVRGVDVNFYLSSNATGGDNIVIAGGADVQLSAGGGGELPGILFYQDRNTASNVTNHFTGGSTMELNGIIYSPNNKLSFTGGSELSESAAMIIADKINFSGTTHLGDFSKIIDELLSNTLMLQATLLE